MNFKTVKNQDKKKIVSQPFSLIEMFAVMVLLMFIMLICFTMLNSTQEVFSSTADHNKIFSDVSRVFNMMSRDLQSSIYEQDKISFWHKRTPSNIEELNFIAVRKSSKICEIRYRKYGVDIFNIQRAEIPPETHKWKFYGEPLSKTGIMHDEGFNNLMKNVTELKFTCFSEDGTEITPSQTTDNDTEYPFSVKIDITCMADQAAFTYKENNSDEFKKQNERKFSKTVYLGNRQ